MNFRLVVTTAFLLCLGWGAAGLADDLTIKPGDTVQKVLEDQKGKRVTVRLLAGEELTGKVKNVSKELLHLGELAGKEFYDAIVDMNKVSAIIVRVK
jgi:hypothetical protein